MECNYRICSFCKGVNHSAEYKLKATNFSILSVDLTAGNTPRQVVTPGSLNKTYRAVICNECRDAQVSPIAPVLAVMELAKANDADISAIINA